MPNCSWGQLALALGHGLGLWVPGHRDPVSAPVTPNTQQGGEGRTSALTRASRTGKAAAGLG